MFCTPHARKTNVCLATKDAAKLFALTVSTQKRVGQSWQDKNIFFPPPNLFLTPFDIVRDVLTPFWRKSFC